MKINKSGYLKVSKNHELYYECKGNPEGITVLFLHGGPGDCFKKKHERNFDEKLYNVIFFDQRACGKSRFLGEDVLLDNNTDELVEDMVKLLDFFNLEKVNIFGRSWGSTLALIFAIKYPEKVSSMVIGGIWLAGEKPENDFLYGNGVKNIFPDFWEEFLESIPEKIRDNTKKIFEYINKEIKKEKYEALIALGKYEIKLLKLEWRIDLDEIDSNDKEFINGLKIFFHYVYNSCFISKNYILDNSYKLDNINISIIHGRYDSICPAIGAYKLEKNLKKSKLYFSMGGHSSSDGDTLEFCKREVKKMFV